MRRRLATLAVAAALLHACAPLATANRSERADNLAGGRSAPAGATIEPSGFATVLTSPARPLPERPPATPPPPTVDPLYAERMANPDEALMGRAYALERRLKAREPANFVEMIIIRDPKPRFAIYFRRNAAATLAKYTRDSNFKPVDGGIPEAELRPIFETWSKRFSDAGLAWGGGTQAYQGVVEFHLDLPRSTFERIAAERRWTIPDTLKLSFAPELGPMADILADIAPYIRAFPRVPQWTRMVNAIGLSGRLVLRDGCFRVIDGADDYTGLAIFSREARLFRDAQGYLSVGTANDESALRVGQTFLFGIGNPGEESDPEIRTLRAQCGSDRLVGVGVPQGQTISAFQLDQYAQLRGLSRGVAWQRIRECWVHPPDKRPLPAPGEQIVWTECDHATGRVPFTPPPPPPRR